MRLLNKKLTSTINRQGNLRVRCVRYLNYSLPKRRVLLNKYLRRKKRNKTQNQTKTVKRTHLKYNKQHLDNIEQYDLAMVKNVNRSTDTWDLLEKLEQGKLNFPRMKMCANTGKCTGETYRIKKFNVKKRGTVHLY